MKKVTCIMGPTGSGKTALAIELVKKHPYEIISVDSALVYRGMDIGTAKPTKEELKLAPHRLINICDPSQPYSAGQFYQDAQREIEDIFKKNKTPLLVGGTMLYFRAIQFGLADLPAADANTRKAIEKEAEQLGWPVLHERLKQIDPTAAEKINPNDAQRIQRALEVYDLTGKPISEFSGPANSPALPYEFENIALIPEDRQLLHQRIEKRFDQMLAQGFIEEVEKLYQREDIHPDLPAIRAVGYRQVWEYLDGKVDEATMREKAIIATRQLAKRQLTWLRSWPNLNEVRSQVAT